MAILNNLISVFVLFLDLTYDALDGRSFIWVALKEFQIFLLLPQSFAFFFATFSGLDGQVLDRGREEQFYGILWWLMSSTGNEELIDGCRKLEIPLLYQGSHGLFAVFRDFVRWTARTLPIVALLATSGIVNSARGLCTGE
jgi:hypothetical protein